jgi:hypothetical protein
MSLSARDALGVPGEGGTRKYHEKQLLLGHLAPEVGRTADDPNQSPESRALGLGLYIPDSQEDSQVLDDPRNKGWWGHCKFTDNQ